MEFSRQEYCLTLLQGIFLIQGSNSSLGHCRQILYYLNHQVSWRAAWICCMWPQKQSTWEQIIKYPYRPKGKEDSEAEEFTAFCFCRLLKDPPSFTSEWKPCDCRAIHNTPTPTPLQSGKVGGPHYRVPERRKPVARNTAVRTTKLKILFFDGSSPLQRPYGTLKAFLPKPQCISRGPQMHVGCVACIQEDTAWRPQASKGGRWFFEDRCYWLALCFLWEDRSDSQRPEQTTVLILPSFCTELILVVWWANQAYLENRDREVIAELLLLYICWLQFGNFQ